MNIDVEVDYDLGSGGSATAFVGNETFTFAIEERSENQYADVDIEIIGDGNDYGDIIHDAYNRNSLPSGQDIGENLSDEEYAKIFRDTKFEIEESVKRSIENFFE